MVMVCWKCWFVLVYSAECFVVVSFVVVHPLIFEHPQLNLQIKMMYSNQERLVFLLDFQSSIFLFHQVVLNSKFYLVLAEYCYMMVSMELIHLQIHQVNYRLQVQG